MPAFDLTPAELLLALMRGLFVAALFSSFGALLFQSFIAPAAQTMSAGNALALDRRDLVLTHRSLLAAALLLLGWLVLQAAAIADAGNVSEALAAIPTVLWNTSFGKILAAQALGLLGSALVLTLWRHPQRRAATGLAGGVVLLQAGHSHAFAMAHGPSWLLLSQGMHLLAAGAWLGGLLPLLLLIRAEPSNIGAVAARRFSTLGVSCVLILAASATFQAWSLAGGFRGLTGTAYGWVILAKTALFTVLVILAALNRFRFAPALSRHPPQRSGLVCSIAAETGLGLLAILAAGVLSSLEPGSLAHDDLGSRKAEAVTLSVHGPADPHTRTEAPRTATAHLANRASGAW